MAGEPGAANKNALLGYGVDKTTKLAGEMRMYLEDMLKLQRGRDVVVEVAKVVVYMLSDKLVERITYLISDIPVERREKVSKVTVEENKKVSEYVTVLVNPRIKSDS